MARITLLLALAGLLAFGTIAGAGEGIVDQHSGSSHNRKCLYEFGREDTTLVTDTVQVSFTAVVNPPLLEIQPLIVSGPSENRVDLVFFSDGYILEEREKFIQDALRLAEDVSGNQTFNTVKPLLNFWAAFTPSEESGVGTGGKPKKTPYGLYRDGTELRAVYYAYPEVADAACTSMGQQCDFPILLGNDPLYGGLGGRFTVITSSILNGPLILRHELGHSIIPVGEEYDGGFAYFGANAYHNLSEPVPWTHWQEKDQILSNMGPRVERSVMPLQIYPWTLLNTSSPYTSTFISSGTFPRYLVRFSLSGLPSKHDLRVELDGKDLGWEPKPGLGVDRWHYDIKLGDGWDPEAGRIHRGGLKAGSHELSFVLLNKDGEGEAQLCSAEVLEFGSEEEFVSAPGYYGVFPTYSDTNLTSYRPTNEDCLMRVVTTPDFCSVCLEGLWHALLARVRLIDSFVVVTHDSAPTGDETEHVEDKVTIEVKLVPLAQFRLDSIQSSLGLSRSGNNNDDSIRALAESESYTITWTQDGIPLPQFTNMTRIEVQVVGGYDGFVIEEAEATKGGSYVAYTVTVQFYTPEVRVDKEGHMSDQRKMMISSRAL
ncbi:IgA peptidase M64-domain-containing protein [Rhodocollybia butyracea]|uniref:IgA peptidase M64-domain-containing protein n=1 Tax=Rhodocollybia butyracea TaxID=206335 RepID=A0A9P5U1W2_9AGAR|nr:IgA peptidase M64-domain-containing protein [Rhodocollybia butyracea]